LKAQMDEQGGGKAGKTHQSGDREKTTKKIKIRGFPVDKRGDKPCLQRERKEQCNRQPQRSLKKSQERLETHRHKRDPRIKKKKLN